MRETFSGLTLLWGADDGVRALPITVSGAPLFDSSREFVGFRGFGIIGEAIATARPATSARPEPDEDALAPDHAPTTAADADPVALAIDQDSEESRTEAPREFR